MSNFQSSKTDGSESVFGEVIFSYTRAQAIEGGVLIDVTPTALEAGFRFPVAATAALRRSYTGTCRCTQPLR